MEQNTEQLREAVDDARNNALDCQENTLHPSFISSQTTEQLKKIEETVHSIFSRIFSYADPYAVRDEIEREYVEKFSELLTKTTPSHEEIKREAPEYGKPMSTFIQWKGTDLCMDWFCRHGHQNHWDGDFAYEIPCETCGEVYKLDDKVKLTYLTQSKERRE